MIYIGIINILYLLDRINQFYQYYHLIFDHIFEMTHSTHKSYGAFVNLPLHKSVATRVGTWSLYSSMLLIKPGRFFLQAIASRRFLLHAIQNNCINTVFMKMPFGKVADLIYNSYTKVSHWLSLFKLCNNPMTRLDIRYF